MAASSTLCSPSLVDTRVRCESCSGARRLSIAACWVPLVRFLIIIFFVVAWPLSKLIDKLLGDEGHTQLYRRSELKELIERHAGTAHRVNAAVMRGGRHTHTIPRHVAPAEAVLGRREISFIHGAIDLKHKLVKSITVPWHDVYCIPET